MELFKAVYALIKNSDHANGFFFKFIFNLYAYNSTAFLIFFIYLMSRDKKQCNKFRYYLLKTILAGLAS